jgi:hypothetical protein
MEQCNTVIGVGLVLVFFSAPHLIDDFLYGIPEEFGLTNQQTQMPGRSPH